jgi:hypothetical protein
MVNVALVTPERFTPFVTTVELVELIGTVTRYCGTRNRIACAHDEVVKRRSKSTSAIVPTPRLPAAEVFMLFSRTVDRFGGDTIKLRFSGGCLVFMVALLVMRFLGWEMAGKSLRGVVTHWWPSKRSCRFGVMMPACLIAQFGLVQGSV